MYKMYHNLNEKRNICEHNFKDIFEKSKIFSTYLYFIMSINSSKLENPISKILSS